MSHYSYSYSASESYNSRTGDRKAIYSAKETINGTVRRNIKAERVGEDQYVLYKHDGTQWVRDTNRGRYYTRKNLAPYLREKSEQRPKRKNRSRVQRGG